MEDNNQHMLVLPQQSLHLFLTATTSDVDILNITDTDINIGDYLLIDEEIVRVKTTVTGNPVKVFRGVLGTKAVSHDINSVIKRIDCRPIEFRRNSIIRASGHTFEYVGFGFLETIPLPYLKSKTEI